MAAELSGMSLTFVESDMKLVKSKEFSSKTPFGKIPVLETPEGCLHQSNAILRYVASS
jgi:elongation factor 1-gamma